MKREHKYLTIQNYLKELIQRGNIQVGDYLPSEPTLCSQFNITRTTVRKALDELLREGFIEKEHGKGSRVLERRQSLGLLAVQGFSEAAGGNVRTIFLQEPNITDWNPKIMLPVSEKNKADKCVHFERLRFMGDHPVMLENNWYAASELAVFGVEEMVAGSFFKTLSQKYLIEIKGSQQEIRAEHANKKVAQLLKIQVGAPILHISIRFKTSRPRLIIYSELYCNTNQFPIGNNYTL